MPPAGSHDRGAAQRERPYLCALFSRPEGFPDGDYSYRHLKVKAAVHPLTVVFDNVPRRFMPRAPITTKTITENCIPMRSANQGYARSTTVFTRRGPLHLKGVAPRGGDVTLGNSHAPPFDFATARKGRARPSESVLARSQ